VIGLVACGWENGMAYRDAELACVPPGRLVEAALTIGRPATDRFVRVQAVVALQVPHVASWIERGKSAYRTN
jgi:hypothetical protein